MRRWPILLFLLGCGSGVKLEHLEVSPPAPRPRSSSKLLVHPGGYDQAGPGFAFFVYAPQSDITPHEVALLLPHLSFLLPPPDLGLPDGSRLVLLSAEEIGRLGDASRHVRSLNGPEEE